MTPERWGAIQEVFAAASGLDGAAREAFLADRCAGDEQFRREVERLLRHDDKPSLASPLSAGAGLLEKTQPRRPDNIALQDPFQAGRGWDGCGL